MFITFLVINLLNITLLFIFLCSTAISATVAAYKRPSDPSKAFKLIVKHYVLEDIYEAPDAIVEEIGKLYWSGVK